MAIKDLSLPKRLHYADAIFALIAISASFLLALQTLFTTFNYEPLCTTSECETVEALLKISPSYLFALSSAWFAAVCLSKLSKQPVLANSFPFVFVPGVAFEGFLLGYAIGHDIPCQTCVGVGISIGSMTILNTLQRRPLSSLPALCWIVAISAALILASPAKVSNSFNLGQNAVVSIENDKKGPEHHLYLGLSCTHCRRLLEQAQNAPLPHGQWYIHFPQRNLSQDDARRIQLARHNAQGSSGTLLPILEAHTASPGDLPSIPPEVYGRIQTMNAQSFADFSDMGFNGLPALVVIGPSERRFVSGEIAISRYLSGEE